MAGGKRIPTPFAGANRSRFEGLRQVRTLSARWRSPVVRISGYTGLPNPMVWD